MDAFIQKRYGRCCGYEFRNWRLELFDKARLMWRKKAKLVVPLTYSDCPIMQPPTNLISFISIQLLDDVVIKRKSWGARER